MKKIIAFSLIASFVTALLSCSNNNSSQLTAEKSKIDTLFDQVMNGHNVGMSRMGKITDAQKAIKNMIDSIAKLPAKAQEAAAPLKDKLNSSLEDLKTAEKKMNKWMEDFNIDSATNDAQKRIDYLTSEKGKVTEVKEAIVTSLQRADSLIKAKL